MDKLPYITDGLLPLYLDFASLKREAINYVQEHMGSEWTNFNPSDPGVTILEQVCYALTELGYCTDFETADILTDKAGNLELKDQFYLPNQILTTSPVTTGDYTKYIIDGIKGVENARSSPVFRRLRAMRRQKAVTGCDTCTIGLATGRLSHPDQV